MFETTDQLSKVDDGSERALSNLRRQQWEGWSMTFALVNGGWWWLLEVVYPYQQRENQQTHRNRMKEWITRTSNGCYNSLYVIFSHAIVVATMVAITTYNNRCASIQQWKTCSGNYGSGSSSLQCRLSEFARMKDWLNEDMVLRNAKGRRCARKTVNNHISVVSSDLKLMRNQIGCW